MVIMLPNDKDGLGDLEKNLKRFDFSTSFKFIMPMEYRIQIPKFKIESEFNLKKTLQDIGVKDLFDKGKADLSGATGNKDLVVSKVIQKAFIEVNEEGSEAAAATGLVAVSRSMTMPHTFICDHPFFFFIKDSKTGLILFNGRVLDPSAK